MAGSDVYCASASLAAGEPLAGTAVRADAWIALEHDGPWASKPEETRMPARLQRRLLEWLEAIPTSRLQLIRRPGRSRGAPARLVVSRSEGASPWISEIAVDSSADLAEIDVPRWIETGVHPGARPLEGPVLLVCAHGRRDRCCAKWGTVVYRELAAAVPDRVWQTTHLGGHRFAPTLVALPEGIQYGRVDPASARRIVESYPRGRMGPLDLLRGRTTLDAPVQAAEIAVRLERNLHGIAAVSIASCKPIAAGWRVRGSAGGDAFAVRVATEFVSAAPRPKSCGAAPEAFERLDAHVEPG